ncbi:MAG: GAF domain-containing protein [Vulcanimicrobiaceae bacterium]
MREAAADEDVLAQARALLAGERDPIANAANLCALIFDALSEVNWAGFYFVRGRELVLGPFQGKPACVRIAYGTGVCGAAWARRETLLVDDVHAFAGHIACDSASNAELVVPLRAGERTVGVLDLDSPRRGRFGAVERDLLEALAALYVEASDFGASD